MKAAVLYGKEDVRVEEVAPPTLKPSEVRIASSLARRVARANCMFITLAQARRSTAMQAASIEDQLANALRRPGPGPAGPLSLDPSIAAAHIAGVDTGSATADLTVSFEIR